MSGNASTKLYNNCFGAAVSSQRAALRSLLRQVEGAARERFGQNFPLRVYVDTSDGDPANFDACIQYTVKPATAKHWMLFPDSAITRPTKEEALLGLLRALEKRS